MKINFLILASFLAMGLTARADWGLDENTWNTLAPFSDSEMTINNGSAMFLNRGILISAVSFPIAYQITGSFEFTGDSNNQLIMNLRTDGSLLQPANNFPLGTYVAFGGGDNGINSQNPNIKIEDDIAGTVAETSFDLSMNAFYNFSIVDTGQNISLYFDNQAAPLLALETGSQQGGVTNLMDIEDNRGGVGGDPHEGENVGVVLNNFLVTPVPEPSTYSVFALSLLGFYLRQKLLPKPINVNQNYDTP